MNHKIFNIFYDTVLDKTNLHQKGGKSRFFFSRKICNFIKIIKTEVTNIANEWLLVRFKGLSKTAKGHPQLDGPLP